MSEMKRAARRLVETRTEAFASRHPLAESRARLEAALQRAHLTPDETFEAAWSEAEGRATLTATFRPAPSTRWLLHGFSVAFILLGIATAYVLTDKGAGSMPFLVPLTLVLAILGFPFVSLALASQRDAREASIARAIRAALQDEEQAYPAARKWDEDA